MEYKNEIEENIEVNKYNCYNTFKQDEKLIINIFQKIKELKLSSKEAKVSFIQLFFQRNQKQISP